VGGGLLGRGKQSGKEVKTLRVDRNFTGTQVEEKKTFHPSENVHARPFRDPVFGRRKKAAQIAQRSSVSLSAITKRQVDKKKAWKRYNLHTFNRKKTTLDSNYQKIGLETGLVQERNERKKGLNK